MLKNKILFLLLGGLLCVLPACEDPDDTFDPKNPDLSEDAVLGTINSAARLLAGTERQLALVLNEVVVVTEIASDNYTNTRTFYNQFLDKLNIQATDTDINDIQYTVARMRELAQTGLEKFGPADPAYTENQQAEFRFYEGMAFLLAGELFRALPAEPGGVPVSSEQNLQNAIASFEEGLRVATDDVTRTSLTLARARAHYHLGNREEAVADAQAAIALDPEFVRLVDYDPVNLPLNAMQSALFDRGSFDDLQPLPSLDFLDPKYNGSDPTDASEIAVLKIEEAHLIIAEAQLSQGSLEEAKTTMKNIIDLVNSRPTETFSDKVEGRTQAMPGSRPNTANVVVAVGPGEPFEDDLVLERQAESVTIPVISGTSFTAAEIDALGSVEEALEALYRMRQEIFISEGRRMVDLGIKFVISEIEFLANPNVAESDKLAVLPPFIAAVQDQLDAYTFDAATGQVTISVNLNEIIVNNRTSEFVVPFF